MVVFHVKSGDSDAFLYEASCETNNGKLIRDLVEIWNLRIRLRQLCGSIRELGEYGPMKQPEKVGIDHIKESYEGERIDKNQYYNADPSGLRSGNRPGPESVSTLEQVALDAESVLDMSLVTRKVAITQAILQEKLDNIRGAVTIAYPMGLPKWDTIQLTIEGIDGLQGTAAGQEILDPNTAELWVASRFFDRNESISDRLGKNDKTKVIAKLQRNGGGAPGREAGVSEEEKKAMMAYYFKKQEEMKQLAENNEDNYLNSSWADPKQLQRSLRGQTGAIKAPGVKF